MVANLHIIFELYPTINYGNSSNNNNNVLEKNIQFRQYIQKKVKRSIHKITNIQFHIPEEKFTVFFHYIILFDGSKIHHHHIFKLERSYSKDVLFLGLFHFNFINI